MLIGVVPDLALRRRTCYEPLVSTHPDTQGGAGEALLKEPFLVEESDPVEDVLLRQLRELPLHGLNDIGQRAAVEGGDKRPELMLGVVELRGDAQLRTDPEDAVVQPVGRCQAV